MQQLSAHFREREPVVDAIVFVAMVTLVAVAAYLAHRWYRQRTVLHAQQDPARLFRLLVRKLSLPGPQRRLLYRVAQHGNVRQPATMLLCELHFDRLVQDWSDARSPLQSESATQAENAMVVALRRNLFGDAYDMPERQSGS